MSAAHTRHRLALRLLRGSFICAAPIFREGSNSLGVSTGSEGAGMGPPLLEGIPRSARSVVGRFGYAVREGHTAPCSVIRDGRSLDALHVPQPGYAFTCGPDPCRVSRSSLAASAPLCLRSRGLLCPDLARPGVVPCRPGEGVDCVVCRSPPRFPRTSGDRRSGGGVHGAPPLEDCAGVAGAETEGEEPAYAALA